MSTIETDLGQVVPQSLNFRLARSVLRSLTRLKVIHHSLDLGL